MKFNSTYHNISKKSSTKRSLLPKITSFTLPSSSPLRSVGPRLLVINKATKKSEIEKTQIDIKINTSYSSSPSSNNSPIINKNKKKFLKNLELEDYSCDFSQIKCYDEQIVNPINNILQNSNKVDVLNKKYDIDESVSIFLNKFYNDGIFDLQLEEVSYGADFHNYNENYDQFKTRIQYQITYFKNYLEAIIEIPSFESKDCLKNEIVLKLKNMLLNSQTGPRKYKVIILTPRLGASWLERKLKYSRIIKFNNDYQYILVKVKKSFEQNVRDCLSEFM